MARWAEFYERFGTNTHRLGLLSGLRQALLNLKDAGCQRAYIDGSFVGNEPFPGDFDGCWDASGVDPDRLDPILLRFDDKRFAQKAKYLGELFPDFGIATGSGLTFLEFFQIDKYSGDPKGIIEIPLETLV